MRLLKWTLILLSFTFVLAVTAFAQTATGEVNGTVSDPNGAAVSGAAVKLVNQGTKAESETTTNQSGYFTFVNLKPATYVLMVEVTASRDPLPVLLRLGLLRRYTKHLARGGRDVRGSRSHRRYRVGPILVF
jgi:hypothetical protein